MNEERLPKEWNISTVIPIKKGARSLCENHRGISLVNVASKVLSGLIMHRGKFVRIKLAFAGIEAVFSP